MVRHKKHERIETRVDQFFTTCERILLRVLLFGCFLAELRRFIIWAVR